MVEALETLYSTDCEYSSGFSTGMRVGKRELICWNWIFVGLPSVYLSLCQKGNIDYSETQGSLNLTSSSLVSYMLAAEHSCILTLFCIPMDLLSEALQIECLPKSPFHPLGSSVVVQSIWGQIFYFKCVHQKEKCP